MGCLSGIKSSGRRKRSGNEEESRNVPARRGKKKIAEHSGAADANRGIPAASLEFKLRKGIAPAADEWPPWLVNVAGHAIKDWKPRLANTFEKLDKIGQGTYSNVYKARDLITGKLVALKKVRFDCSDQETVRFMSREILVLRRLNHPNVIQLEGLVISRISCSLYLVFEYMEHDLAGLASIKSANFSLPQIKCYMKQLFSGLEHCHNNGVLHRDIKCSNLLISNEGVLKIADFGLASFFDSDQKKPMTSRVVTLWYRPPELLLGATYYGVGVDLWSASCILAELLVGKAILRGRTEVEQLHKIFKLCGSPSDEYWKNSGLTNATLYKPQQSYKRCIAETCKEFPSSSIALIENLLAIEPDARETATAALNSEFFTTEPYACEPSSLPAFPPSKEMDMKLKDEENRRQRGFSGKPLAVDGHRRVEARDKVSRARPAPEANAELQTNLDRLRIMSNARTRCKSEKFPPPHQDGAIGHPMNGSRAIHASINPADSSSFTFSVSNSKSLQSQGEVAPQGAATTAASDGRKNDKEEEDLRRVPSRRRLIRAFYTFSMGWSMDFMFNRKLAVSGNSVNPA